MNIQFKKGVLELCVLTLLKTKDYYGYELAATISNEIDVSEGTIYPLLKRMKKEDYVKTYLKESTEGPPRKYYQLTNNGLTVQEKLLAEWYKFCNHVNILLKNK